MWWNDGHMGGWMWFAWIGAGLLVCVSVWALLRAMQQGQVGPTSPERDSPEDELRRRYARGEIDAVEYKQKLEDLRR